MVMKAGANTSDKNRIRKLYSDGLNVDQIAATCSIRLPHVIAICKAIDEGTFRVSGGANPSYGLGDQDGRDAVVDPSTASGMVVNQAQEEADAARKEADALRKELEEAKAEVAAQAELLEQETEPEAEDG